MSESLPNSGVEAVALSRFAVTTQDMLSMSPRLAAMVGSAVATITESSAASIMASSTPSMIRRAAAWSR